MNICPDIEDFIAQLEIYANQKLNFPEEVGTLLQIAMQSGRTGKLEELCFQAKFLVKINEIMKRIGPGADGFEKLSSEFQSGVQNARDIINMLVQQAPVETATTFTDSFINMQNDSFHRFINLLVDLSWIKNWQIDGNALPYEKKTTSAQNHKDGTSNKGNVEKTLVPLVQIERSALMALILLVLFFFIDSPVTLLGWILSLGIAVFLAYIILQVYILIRTPKS
jgi:hypothetical protein